MMQFFTSALMAFVRVCIQIASISFIQNIVVGIFCTIIGGVFLYQMYSNLDEERYHKSTADRKWTKLPSGIWYSNPRGEIPISNHKLVFGVELSPEEQRLAQQLSRRKLIMYVDYPVSMRGILIEARGKTIVFGHERVDCLPGPDNRKWDVLREETQKSPEGYVGERLELIMNL